MKVVGNEPITLWMIRWAAMICSRYIVGKDGKTGYERRRGRKCKIPVVPFGEMVWYRQIRKGKAQQNKLESEMKSGIWLGHARSSNECLIGTDNGVVRAYDVRRRPEAERWNEDADSLPARLKPGSAISFAAITPLRIYILTSPPDQNSRNFTTSTYMQQDHHASPGLHSTLEAKPEEKTTPVSPYSTTRSASSNSADPKPSFLRNQTNSPLTKKAPGWPPPLPRSLYQHTQAAPHTTTAMEYTTPFMPAPHKTGSAPMYMESALTEPPIFPPSAYPPLFPSPKSSTPRNLLTTPCGSPPPLPHELVLPKSGSVPKDVLLPLSSPTGSSTRTSQTIGLTKLKSATPSPHSPKASTKGTGLVPAAGT